MAKVALVTGANRGIGFAVVRGLCKVFDGDVILTARDEARGKEAVQSLTSEGLNPKFHYLDIADPQSVSNIKDFIQKAYGGIDVIIQNASIGYPPDTDVSLGNQAEILTKVNNFGAQNIILSLLPLVRPHGRIVIFSSGFGLSSSIPGESIRKRLEDRNLTLEGLDTLQNEYIQDTKANRLKEKGWPEWTNATSKVCLLTFTKILARQLKIDPREDIVINAVCPGWTVTEATKAYLDEKNTFNGIPAKQPDEAAVDVIYLATLPQGAKEPYGKLVQYRKVLG